MKRDDLLRTLINSLPDWIYVKDLDSVTLLVNQALAEMLGREDPEALVGTTDFDTYPREMAEKFFRCEQDILFSGTPMINREAQVEDADGGVRHVSSTKVPIRDEDGVPVGLVGIARDITERKLAEQRLRQAMDELSRSNLELEQFAYAVSHDLQEPLRQVASFVQLLELRYGEQLDERGRGYVDHAVQGVEQMRQMILDLLAYSRLGKASDTPEQVPLDSALARARRQLAGAISESGAAISVKGELPVVRGDQARLSQLLQNLLGNAMKFRHADRAPEIQLRAEPADEGMWRLAVRDNGSGIRGDDPERVFRIFQRLHPKQANEGTGVGLTLCRRIVENHGGKIWYESEPGAGTTFFVTLPGA